MTRKQFHVEFANRGERFCQWESLIESELLAIEYVTLRGLFRGLQFHDTFKLFSWFQGANRTVSRQIFAIFMVKPSPFCVLDEVDAPLDDTNIGKFNALLKEMSAKTQFILITHNKKTMELNDTLYGVTMEEPGVSKMVSIEMQ